MTDFLNLDYTECLAVIVTLKNSALASPWYWYDSYQGMYQISDPINGKPTWILPPYAIWYNSEHGDWLIGFLDDIGQNLCTFYASDDYGGLDDSNNQWNYWHSWDGNFVSAGANDVNITCTSNNIFLAECSTKKADYKI